ncbi:MAG: sensor histidine kinase [Desulfovibrionaceae bacterium]
MSDAGTSSAPPAASAAARPGAASGPGAGAADRAGVWPRFSLRRKIFASLLLFIAAILAVGILSFNDLATIDRKLVVLSGTHSLSDLILETRRFEKNFLLYHQAGDLEECRRFLGQARQMAGNIAPELQGLKVRAEMERLTSAIAAYDGALHRMDASAPGGAVPPPDLVAELRLQGKAMLDLIQDIVRFERGQVQGILATLKWQLVASIAVVLILGPMAVFIMFGNLLSILGSIRRTTERIAQGRFERLPESADQELKLVMEGFNRMVVELETRQEQLVQARKLSSIGTLAAGIAHQLNNPLNNISTSCQIAQEEAGGQELVGRMLRNIEQESLRARDIVKGLLEFSRERDFSPKLTELAPLVERTVKLASSQVPPRVRVTVAVPADLALEVDSQRLQEVLLNLILNAVDALDGAEGAITVSASAPEPPAGAAARPRGERGPAMAELVVQDNGPGVPAEIRDRIFDPFYTTKDDSGGSGTGLGLSIAYGIIERHGGHIHIEDAPGGGARFVIRLPLPGAGRTA